MAANPRGVLGEMAAGIGILTVLYALLISVPVLGVVGMFAIPLPALVFRLKQGRNGAVLMTAAALALSAGIFGVTLDLVLFLMLLALGVVLGESFERNFSMEKSVGIACGVLTLGGVLLLLFYSQSVGVGIPDLFSSYVKLVLSSYEAAMKEMAASEETRQALSASIEVIGSLLVRTLPGLLISGFLFMAWTTVLLVRPILNRLGLPCPVAAELTRWRAPEKLVWGAIGCGILVLIPDDGLKTVGINGLLVLVQVYFFQGIAIIAFFFEKKGVPLLVRGILYAMVTVQFFLLLLVVGLGFFDMWLNVRRLPADSTTRNDDFKLPGDGG